MWVSAAGHPTGSSVAGANFHTYLAALNQWSAGTIITHTFAIGDIAAYWDGTVWEHWAYQGGGVWLAMD